MILPQGKKDIEQRQLFKKYAEAKLLTLQDLTAVGISRFLIRSIVTELFLVPL